ncbi:MAG: TadE/TadG family type IV pilus assembly protein [Caulobacteraceae bacterium]
MIWLSSLRAFTRDRRGASAVEFGLIAPVLAFALLSVAELGQIVYQRTDMHGALRSGGQYVLNGGRDLAVAREIVVRSWTAMPEDAIVEATRFCLCGAVEHACSTPCSGGSVPEAYISLHAHATLGGIVVDYGDTADDSIRVR